MTSLPDPLPVRQLDLEDRWAVVTGSTRGIGRAIAVRLAGAGARLIVHGRDTERAAETAALVRGQGREAVVVVADLATSAGRRRLLDATLANYCVDVWVNNAGADVLTGEAASLSFAEKLQRLWHTDVEATLELSRAAGAEMSKHRGGSLVNMGWDRAEHGMAGDSGEMFAAVKGAVMAFSRSLAQSLAPRVRVNCVAPGWIRTAWGDQASSYWQRRAVDEALRARWGTPDDVAQAVVWLCSPAADFVNGQTLHVNGGWRTSDASSSP